MDHYMPVEHRSLRDLDAMNAGRELGEEALDLSAIKATQSLLRSPSPSGPLQAYASDPLPLVFRDSGGNLWLLDGHHRAAALLNRGDTQMRARVLGEK